MATKKAASTAKKSAAKKTTKVTTVKATARPKVVASSRSKKPSFKLNFSRSLAAALIAEFIGTFILAAAIIAGQGQPIIVFFALVGVVLAVSAISGSYLNPALTIAGWLTRRLSGLRALFYIVAQVLGAMLALVTLTAFVNAAPAANPADLYSASAPTLFKAVALPAGKEWFVFLAELLGTTILGFAVANATRELKERTAAAFTVGLGVFLGLMVAGSAASYIGGIAILNPAIAVSLQAINFSSMWPLGIYAVATTLGGVVGFVLYDFLRGAKQEA